MNARLVVIARRSLAATYLRSERIRTLGNMAKSANAGEMTCRLYMRWTFSQIRA